jgi:hypothetical protein
LVKCREVLQLLVVSKLDFKPSIANIKLLESKCPLPTLITALLHVGPWILFRIAQGRDF